MCPERVCGPRLRNQNVKNVWGLRPHTFFTLLLRNLGPQTPSGHNFCTILILCIFRIVPGDGLLQPKAPEALGTKRTPKPNKPVWAPPCRRGDYDMPPSSPTQLAQSTVNQQHSYPTLRNSASGPEIGLPGRISAGF